MSNAIIYSTATGEILRLVSAPPDMLSIQAGVGESWQEGEADQLTQYMLSDVLTNKPANPTTINTTSIPADGSAGATLSNIPNPSTVTINIPQGAAGGGLFTITDGALLFAATFAGEYKITVEKFPYLPFTATVTAA